MKDNRGKKYTDGRPLPPPYSEEESQAKAATAVTAAPTVTVLPGAVVVQPAFSSEPSKTYCKSCHAEIVTNVKFKNTTKTHMFAAGLCFIGGLLCVWIPYYVKSCRNADHYCPNCGAYLGTYVP
ncbi:hypothetical protein ABMA27_015851 [Loxostege sticticalis]|uniref:LITAF domain-containing protein n=1 Tax=Loxostege sticticalis TaxID=481309 RepID=A0ABR3I4M6_LOXSC